MVGRPPPTPSALAVGVLLIATVFAVHAASPAPSTSGFGARLSPDSVSGVTGYVYADLNNYATTSPLVRTTVTVLDDCTAYQSLTCTTIGTTATNATGYFAMNLPSGSGYYVSVSANATPVPDAPFGFGGAVQPFTAPTSTPLMLDVYPLVPYGNTSIVLPRYNCLAAYVDNYEGLGPGCQNPVLSWTQDGAYYVNATDELVFYSFINGSASPVAPWTPLYQGFPTYAMIPNELFITQDGSYIYSWGALNTSTQVVTVEAVNVTTHRVFLYNFSTPTISDVATNGELFLTGWDGNDSLAVLIDANDEMFDHDLWNNTESTVGTLPFFEANNIYWMAYLNGFINVESGGTDGDYLEELQLSGPVTSSSDYSLTQTYYAPWSTAGITVNGVNGLTFNVSSRELSMRAAESALVYGVLPSGTISGLVTEANLRQARACACVDIGPASESDRPALIDSGPEMESDYNAPNNDTWLTSQVPGHFGFYSTNVSPYIYNPHAFENTTYSWVQWYQEGQFLNSSYIIAPTSYACNDILPGPCTIHGGDGATPGTIWWMWRLGLSRFPFPATNRAADDTAPPAPAITSVEATSTNATLDWLPPPNDVIVNYTAAWGTSSDELVQQTSVLGSASSFTLTGLSPGTQYYASITAWNLHGPGEGSEVSAFVTGPAVVSHVVVTGANETNVSLAWTNPRSGTFSNVTVEVGTSPGALTHHYSVGLSSSYTVSGLLEGTLYYFAIVAWNGSLEGTPSNVVSAATTFVGAADLTVTSSGVSSVSLAWSNPMAGTFTNLTVAYGTAADALTTHLSVGTVTSYSVDGLRPSTTYYFEVVAWNNSVQSLPSNVVSALTSFTGAAYLTVTGTTNRSVSLAWQNPESGTFTNITLEYGTSESVLSQHLSLGIDSSYIVTGLTAATTYYFEVQAWNGTAMGTPSNEVSTITSATPPPVVVVGASALTVTASTQQSISLSWTNPTSGTFTNLTLEFGISVSALSDHLSVGTVSSYIVTGLAPSTTYYFRVIAWNGTTEATPSNEVSASTAAPPPSPTSSSGVSWTDFYLLAAVLVALAIALAVLLLRRRRKPESPVAPWTEGSPTRSGAPPPGPPSPPGGS